MRKIHHPNIINLVEVHETDNSIYMIFEHFNGGSLQDLFSSNIKFKKSQISLIMQGIAKGLAYLHNLKIIHRDIKPHNILFVSDDDYSQPIITDLCLATFEDEAEFIYSKCSTPGYAAPEILNFKPKFDFKYTCISDIFGFGAIFHKL